MIENVVDAARDCRLAVENDADRAAPRCAKSRPKRVRRLSLTT